MIKALELLEEYKIENNIDKEDDNFAEEDIVYLYLAIRLKPLIGTAGISENRINNIATFLAEHYFDKEISLDLMINAIYNYINATKNCPSDKLLTDDIEALLEDYTEWKKQQRDTTLK